MTAKPAQSPTVDRLRELFIYEPETGQVRRKVKAGGETVGSLVGTKNNKGYLICRVDYKIVYVHRIAWALHHGTLPPPMIDHRNGDGTDNRPENIRAATRSQNGANSRPSRKSRSKTRGVHWSSLEKKWRSSIRVNGQGIHLGWFTSKASAKAAYEAAAEKHFGEFSFYRRAA